MNLYQDTINTQLSIFFLAPGLIFVMIAVIGKSRIAFIEIDPGCFGRFLALTLAIISLVIAILLGIFPAEMIGLIKNYFTEQILQNMDWFTRFQPPS